MLSQRVGYQKKTWRSPGTWQILLWISGTQTTISQTPGRPLAAVWVGRVGGRGGPQNPTRQAPTMTRTRFKYTKVRFVLDSHRGHLPSKIRAISDGLFFVPRIQSDHCFITFCSLFCTNENELAVCAALCSQFRLVCRCIATIGPGDAVCHWSKLWAASISTEPIYTNILYKCLVVLDAYQIGCGKAPWTCKIWPVVIRALSRSNAPDT